MTLSFWEADTRACQAMLRPGETGSSPKRLEKLLNDGRYFYLIRFQQAVLEVQVELSA